MTREPVGGLFASDPYLELDAYESLGVDARRTRRQRAAMDEGWHPFGAPLHPDAPPPDDRDAPGPRCGSCVHATRMRHHDRTYVKCGVDGVNRVSHTAASDLRLWWPACNRWKGAP